MFDNVLWEAAFTRMASNTNAAIIVSQLKVGFVRKDNLLPISPPGSVLMSPLQTQPSMVTTLQTRKKLEACYKSYLLMNEVSSARCPVGKYHTTATECMVLQSAAAPHQRSFR
ncbi:hypothetical protein TNCV_3581751 [Trichonephila clavipes]|nr:hypothetical protein TNCV_3581751 [Trichonephila clavipes]